MNDELPAGNDAAGSLRSAMVDAMARDGWVTTPRVEAAFRRVPRHEFAPGVNNTRVYTADEVIITAHDAAGTPVSSSTPPVVMARMLERLVCEPGARVLEIGTGTGYNAALLGELVGPGGKVTTVEFDAAVAARAAATLEATGARNVSVVAGDGWLGVPEGAPYDRIIVTVGVWDLSPAWQSQLARDGRLVAPFWLGPGFELVLSFEQVGRGLIGMVVDRSGWVRLRGEHAGPDAMVRAGRWSVNLRAPDSSELAALPRLLDSVPRTEPAPPRARWWLAGVALRDPGAVHVFDMENPRWSACGVLDAGDPSLALIAGDELLSYGGDGARRRLLGHLKRCHTDDIRGVSVEVLGLDEEPPADELVLERPSHRFVVRGVE
jgi:protein-L-isoaspartate(D-aspartate) O-methyltransferase